MVWLFTQFLKIAFLTAKPYEVPGDQATLRLSVLFAVATYIVALWGVFSSGSVVGRALLDLVLSGSVLFVALSVFGKPERFAQAFTALCGANGVINLASMPVIYSGLNNPPAAADAPPAIDLIGFFFLVWSISVVAHIIRFSFDTNIPVSIVASVGYLFVALSVYGFVFAT